MRTLLVLGSKPDPALPPRSSFDDLACANASGRSAARLGLPDPRYTVMSAILTSGRSPANDLALAALAGLRTDILHFYPRPPRGGNALRRAVHGLKTYRMNPWYFRWKLRALGYRYGAFENPGLQHDLDLVRRLCGHDPGVLACMARKQPSTGMIALALGVADDGYMRYIVSGFSFEVSHAHAVNPAIVERGSAASKHAETDIAVLNCLARRHGSIFTTERVVHERAGVPMLEEVGG